ncbi:UBX domain-containing protein 4-like [Dendronephthya gigantea]|uniref:UBX domain-containing protein 4-like n=1 Tax=Dendronephthya gigantea TaxID=151771 RepID=UPI0010698153|nr:UBX domain-containing protein 4-like [Dendronephthya gigantea]
MLWFEGSVAEAIAESRRIGSLFVVYIKGNDEQSRKMDAVWENTKINEVCMADCTAIKLLDDSNELKQFSSIYPVICIPCTYFLDGTGTPLEVIAVPLSVDQFLDKINQTIQKHRVKFPKVVAQPNVESMSLPRTSQSPGASTSNGPVQDDSEQSLTDRVTRAKKLIEEKKRERAEKEKEDGRRKEAERRKEGQALLKAKAEREETLAQQMAERIRSEKAKDKAAKEAIRQKIAQDKAERAAREIVQQEERRHVAARVDPRVDHNERNMQCSEVRLQFRLPDGSSLTQNFPPDALLQAAREFICSRTSFTNQVTFWTTFPRKHLVEDDFTRTLSDLGLAPSAALIVDPTTSSSSRASDNSSFVTSMVFYIMAPFLALISWIKYFLFASPQETRGVAEQGTNHETSDSASTSSSSASEIRRRKRDEQNEEHFKKDGKIHSFKQPDKDDDENNTWNGNSTQQM